MPHPESPRNRYVGVLRVLGFVLGVALGAVAVWLIVTSKTQKTLELGVLAGIWGAVFAWFAVTRRASQPDPATLDEASYGALELRSRATDVESAADVARRRADEQRLQEFLRLEIRQSVGREVVNLRGEIERLRTELLEKVGGQLRLEHIETTRVIGSDLEALQSEIRALKVTARDPLSSLRPVPRQGARVLDQLSSAEVRPADATLVEREVVDRAVVDAPAAAAAPPQATPPPAGTGRPTASSFTDSLPRLPRSPVTGGSDVPLGGRDVGFTSPPPVPTPPVPAPLVPAPPVPAVHAPAAERPAGPGSDRQQQSAPTPLPSTVLFERLQAAATSQPLPLTRTDDDPFARMPRLSPFVDDAPTPPPAPPATPQPTSSTPSFGAPVLPGLASPETGRAEGRRAGGAQSREARPDGQIEGGRRRRVEGQNDNLLAKLLEREGH